MGLSNKQALQKERILEWVENQFYTYGFYKVSLDEIVQRLRISKGTIYDYFGSKRGLIAHTVDRFGEKMAYRLAYIVSDTRMSLPEKLLEIAIVQGQRIPNLSPRYLHDLQVHAPDLWQRYQMQRQERIETYYRVLIEEGIQSGYFDPRFSSAFLLHLYLNMSNIVCTTDLLDHVALTRAQAYQQIIEVFVRGTNGEVADTLGERA